MTCRTCGKEERQPHRHGDTALQARIRYGRFVADQERAWIRDLLRRAKAERPRMAGTNDTVETLG